MGVTYSSEIQGVYPSSAITPGVLLTKLRIDYPEFTVTNFIQPNSINGVQLTCTPRFNSTNSVPSQSGTSRLYTAQLVQICPRVLNTISPGTAASLSPTTVTWSSATKTNAGNWTGPTTVSGRANCFFTTTQGEHVTYTVTVPSGGRIAWQTAANGTNGGLVDALVTFNGVEISSTNYSVPLTSGFRQVNLALTNTAPEIELANSLPAGTYVVDLTLDSTSGASSRLYDCQVITTIPLSVSTPGEDGTWIATSAGSVGGNTNFKNSFWACAGCVYSVSNATLVKARIWQVSNAGQAIYTLYDSSGNQLNQVFVDQFGGGLLVEVQLGASMPKGTYYVIVQGLSTKNASSTGYRVYDGGIYGYDQTSVGVLGTDPPTLVTNGIVGGTGNMEHAIESRRVGSPNSQLQFCGGIHGGELQGTPVFTLDGNVINYSAATAGTSWTGTQLVITWTGNTIGFVQPGAAISQTGGVATVVLASHGYTNGDTVNISAATPSAYNGDHTITVVDANTFTYTVAGGTASPATGAIYCTDINNQWCSFTLSQTFDASGYDFVEVLSVTENCFLGFVYGPMLMAPSGASPIGFPGGDSGVRWGFADGSSPTLLTGQSDVSAQLPIAASLVLESGTNRYLMVQDVLSVNPSSCRSQNRSDGYGKMYTTMHEGTDDPTGGDAFGPGQVWTIHGKFRVVSNTSPLILTGPRANAGTRTTVATRNTAGARTLAGTRQLVY